MKNSTLALLLSLLFIITFGQGKNQMQLKQTKDRTMEKKMKIEIWSDIMCPFCYIGKRNFEKALAQFPHRDLVEVEWKSFQLDPAIPETPKYQNDMYMFVADRKGLSYEQSKKGIRI